MNSTPVGPTTSDAVVPPTSTTSVKSDGNAAPADAQGTGITLTNVPIVVVIVEQAVAVPIGSIAPFEIVTPGGACGTACTGSKGRRERRDRKVAIFGCGTEQWSMDNDTDAENERTGGTTLDN